jgi:bifunctional non-homologous end joining protein LigD
MTLKPQGSALDRTGLDFIEPMLPTLVRYPFSNPDWLFEPKWDGYRALCYVEDGVATFISRRGNDLTPQFPALQSIPKSIKAKTAILDGEIVALNAEGWPEFDALRSKKSTSAIVYFAFDLLLLNGKNLMDQTLIARKVSLKTMLLRKTVGRVRYTEHVVEEGEQFFKELEKAKIEGMVAKRMDSLYVSGRTRAWLKVKTKAGKAEMQKRSEAWHG